MWSLVFNISILNWLNTRVTLYNLNRLLANQLKSTGSETFLIIIHLQNYEWMNRDLLSCYKTNNASNCFQFHFPMWDFCTNCGWPHTTNPAMSKEICAALIWTVHEWRQRQQPQRTSHQEGLEDNRLIAGQIPAWLSRPVGGPNLIQVHPRHTDFRRVTAMTWEERRRQDLWRITFPARDTLCICRGLWDSRLMTMTTRLTNHWVVNLIQWRISRLMLPRSSNPNIPIWLVNPVAKSLVQQTQTFGRKATQFQSSIIAFISSLDQGETLNNFRRVTPTSRLRRVLPTKTESALPCERIHPRRLLLQPTTSRRAEATATSMPPTEI